jgi:hypothetical protein
LIENAGIKRYSGAVSVTISSLQGDLRATVGNRYLTCDLGAGEQRAVVIRCAGIYRGSSMIEAGIEAEGDTRFTNDFVSDITSTSPGDVVINEIMYRPAGGGEWLEIFNRSSFYVDLSWWSVSDRAGGSGSISEGVVLPAGGYLIIAQDPGSFSREFRGCGAEVISLTGAWPRLNNSGGDGPAEEIFIRDEGGSLVESVSYPDPLFDEKGRSIERLSPGLCSAATDGIWLRCSATAGATPGESNCCHTESIPAAGILVSPDPYCPGRDGVVRFTASAGGETSFSASIYDMEGREISKLASGPVGAPAVSFVWDGVEANGRRVGTGLYFCVVEFKCGGGGVCRREKCAVRVWAGYR